MAQFPITKKTFLFAPATNAATTVNALPVKKGTRILFGSVNPLILGIGGDTVAIRVAAGGGGNANGLLTATDSATWTVNTPVNLAGSDMDRAGLLVTADSTIDIVTAGAANSTQMKFRLTVGLILHETIS